MHTHAHFGIGPTSENRPLGERPLSENRPLCDRPLSENRPLRDRRSLCLKIVLRFKTAPL